MVHDDIVLILGDPDSVLEILLQAYWNMIHDVLFCSATRMQSK
jgi:hypothetical protein